MPSGTNIPSLGTTMPSSGSSTMSIAFVSDRVGVENMDGQGILAGRPKSSARPWLGCIPFDQLTRDNLPPFYVRLQDDQVGHLNNWVSTSRASITRLRLGQVWPWDFDLHGRISGKRDSWGAEYSGNEKWREKGLGGGKKVPAWTDPGLPLTYTSSHKIMTRQLDLLKTGATLKRKAEEEAGEKACMPVKKPRLGGIGTELKEMKATARKKRQATEKEKEKERYAGGKPEIRDAMQVVDTLMRSATETESQNAALESMLLKNEAQYIKNIDDMFDEWLTYNEVKRKEVDRMLKDHAADISSRDAKMGTLEVALKGSRARLEKEQAKVRVHDKRLAKVSSQWAQEQELVGRKFREIEEMMVDLDELPELNYETDESDGEESDFEAEPEDTDKGAKEEQDVKEAKETKQEQEMKREETKQSKGNGLIDRELGRSLVQEAVKGMEIVNLDGEESEDEGPISRQRKGTYKQSGRSRPTQSA